MSKVLELFEKKWSNVEFESSCLETPQFASFSRTLKNAVKKECIEHGYELGNWNKGHFEVCFFVKRSDNAVFYVSVGDMRYGTLGKNALHCVLYRSALHEKDYGGSHSLNHYCHIGQLFDMLNEAKESFTGSRRVVVCE